MKNYIIDRTDQQSHTVVKLLGPLKGISLLIQQLGLYVYLALRKLSGQCELVSNRGDPRQTCWEVDSQTDAINRSPVPNLSLAIVTERQLLIFYLPVICLVINDCF